VPGQPQIQLGAARSTDAPADVEGQRVAVSTDLDVVEVDEGEGRDGAGVGVGGELGVRVGAARHALTVGVGTVATAQAGPAVGMPYAAAASAKRLS
jgi:hypothetical protein